MKINWGTGIVIGMVAFIGFIMFMVVTMLTDDQYDHDLVTENYYERDLNYQEEIDAEKNTVAMNISIKGEKTADGYLLTFPEEMTTSQIEGKVFLYRPSNKQFDFSIPLLLSDSQLLIPNERLLGGHWNITIDWKSEGKRYMHKSSIFY